MEPSQPGAQLLQESDTDAPMTVDHVPALQLVHVLEAREDEKKPIGQGVHAAWDVEAIEVEYVPLLHLVQNADPENVSNVRNI